MRRLLKAGSRPAPWRAAPVRESPCALSAEVAVGDVTRPEKLALALEGCTGVFSALSASTDRQAGEVEYRDNVNLLSAAREAGMQRFVYTSALLVDHLLARRVGIFREKTRFEEVLLGAEDVCADRFASCVFMETLLMALSGHVAIVPSRQPCPVCWISVSNVDLAAVRHSRAT
jgi:nucleoside-diphosphate-sugar epimerase